MINKLLGIKYPILQGGMDSKTLVEQIRICKSKTDKPFAVNLMLLHPLIDEFAQIVIDEKVPVVTTGAGNPSKYMKSWKDAGIKVIPVVPNLTLAKRVESNGADAIIAEGNESGGHIGPMTTMTILGEIVGNVDIPVIAAGGVCNGRQMLATEVLGASGVQMGTIFLASDECPIHENYKNSIIKSSSNQVTVTGYSISMPVRLIKNEMSRKYLELERKGTDKMELEKYTLGSLKKAVLDGDVKTGSVMAGLVVGQIKEIRPVKQIIESIIAEYKTEWEKISEKSRNKDWEF